MAIKRASKKKGIDSKNSPNSIDTKKGFKLYNYNMGSFSKLASQGSRY